MSLCRRNAPFSAWREQVISFYLFINLFMYYFTHLFFIEVLKNALLTFSGRHESGLQIYERLSHGYPLPQVELFYINP